MGKGLYKLWIVTRLSDASDMSLWEELWLYLKEHFLNFDMGQYENLGLGGGGHLFSLPQMIAMMLVGVILAALATMFNKRVLGDFVRVMLQYEATSPEAAKDLKTLEYQRNSTIRSALRHNVSLRRVVRCLEEEQFAAEVEAQRASYEARRAADPALPPFIEPTFKMDVDTAHFYIAEKDKYMADVKFEKKGNNWFSFVVTVVACIAILALVLFLLPDIFQFIDNFVGMFRGSGRGDMLT